MEMLPTVLSGAGKCPICLYFSCGDSSDVFAFQGDVHQHVLYSGGDLGVTQVQPKGQIWSLLFR